MDYGISDDGKKFLDNLDISWPFSRTKQIEVEFDDGSYMCFNDSIPFVDEKNIIIATEHCGNYIIPASSVKCVISKGGFRESPIFFVNAEDSIYPTKEEQP
jgi:hypothetical protein